MKSLEELINLLCKKISFFTSQLNYWFTMFELIAEFYSKSSPLVSKETSLGRNQYLTSRGREVMGYWGEGSIYRGMGVARRGIVGG